MQTTILDFFQSIATPGLDILAESITMLGEEGVYILIIASFFWGISKKTGMIMSSTLLISLFLNSLLKLVFHSPRPFEVLEQLKAKRLETATGYSFPSGHTQGASSFYTTLIYLYRNKVLRILCGTAILLVGVSRLYLAVHWPVDVLGGWILGIAAAWLIASSIDRLWEIPEQLDRLILIFTGIVALTSIIMALLEIYRFKGTVKVDDFFKGAGIVLGCFGGYLAERRITDFDASQGSLYKKILRVVLGLAGVLLIQSGLKILLPEAFLSHLLRYGCMGLWITLLYPLLGVRIHLFDRKSIL